MSVPKYLATAWTYQDGWVAFNVPARWPAFPPAAQGLHTWALITRTR